MSDRIVVNPLHRYYREDHLAEVVTTMRRLGPPTLRATWDAEAGVWHAHEGTHRLRAAVSLGLVPTMVHVPWRKSREALRRARIGATLNAHVFRTGGRE